MSPGSGQAPLGRDKGRDVRDLHWGLRAGDARPGVPKAPPGPEGFSREDSGSGEGEGMLQPRILRFGFGFVGEPPPKPRPERHRTPDPVPTPGRAPAPLIFRYSRHPERSQRLPPHPGPAPCPSTRLLPDIPIFPAGLDFPRPAQPWSFHRNMKILNCK